MEKSLLNAFKEASVGHAAIDVQLQYCDPHVACDYGATTMEVAKTCDALAETIRDFTKEMRGTAVKHFWVAHTPFPLEFQFPEKSLKEIAREQLYKVRPRKTDTIVGKPNFDAFLRTDFEQNLHARKVSTLLLSGFYLDQCVAETAQSALKLGFNVAVIADLTYCMPDRRDKTLAKLEKLGTTVVTAADVLKLARRR